jgi:hypothetical protein
MDENKITEVIWSQIGQERTADHYAITLPFLFNGEEIELKITWRVEGDYVCISDDGQVMRQLRKQLGDLTPYKKSIELIVPEYGSVYLEGGQNLVCRYLSHGDFYHTGFLNHLLTAISLLSGISYLPLEGGSDNAE